MTRRSELVLICKCGWTKRGHNVTLAWMRIFLHELRNHRKDVALWGANSVTRIRMIR